MQNKHAISKGWGAMKQKRSFNITILAMFSLVLTVLASYSVTHAQDWYDANWAPQESNYH